MFYFSVTTDSRDAQTLSRLWRPTNTLPKLARVAVMCRFHPTTTRDSRPKFVRSDECVQEGIKFTGSDAAVAHARLRLSRLELIGGSGPLRTGRTAGRYASLPRGRAKGAPFISRDCL